MKKLMNNKGIKTVGNFFTAGLLLFGAASCGSDSGNQESTVATEEALEDEGMGAEGMEASELVTNNDADLFSRYDSNTDQQWDRDEFNTSMGESRTYNDWDADRDGSINEQEYTQGISTWQNQNTTGTTETATDAGTTGNTNNFGTFNDWDADRNGTINQDEFNQGTFNSWDADRNGNLSNDEYTTGMGYGTGIGGQPGAGNGVIE